MPVTRLYLVRHGGTRLAAEDRFSGAAGVDLTDDGRRQATRLGARLRDVAFDAIYSSPLERAVQTTELVRAELAQPREISYCDEMREIGHGHWEGMTPAEVVARYPAEHAAWESDPLTVAPVGGESGAQVLARALPALREIVTRHAGGRVLVVSHKATIRLVVASLLGMDPRHYRTRLDQSPSALNLLDFAEPARAKLLLYNDTSHDERAEDDSDAAARAPSSTP